jgi:hypothetical protein
MGPPAICVVFEVPDEDEAQPEDITAQKEELQMVRSSSVEGLVFKNHDYL